MKLKKGRFAKWGGREYELASYQRVYYLATEDSDAQKDGFKPQSGKHGRFIREVSLKELDDAYEIIPYTVYGSHRFLLEGITDDGKAVLVTNDPFVQDKLPLKPYGLHEFIMEIPFEQIKIDEDRIPILGFNGTGSRNGRGKY
ncbi:hypothetical protein ACFFIY_06740 [Bhargavaea ullalensis]|uniref:Uncharacterized protein n=1 Tax=Bhargavaea ullalensis TaxID=1265685 RepID=A0ABV2GEX2_9BACL